MATDGIGAEPTVAVALTAGELLLLRQRLNVTVPWFGGVASMGACDGALDSKLFRAQEGLRIVRLGPESP